MTEVYVGFSQAIKPLGLSVVVFNHFSAFETLIFKIWFLSESWSNSNFVYCLLNAICRNELPVLYLQENFLTSFCSLGRQQKAMHKIKTQNKQLQCNDCNCESPSLVGMIKHTKQLHGSETIHHCVYCSKTFLLKSVFDDHMKLNHGMPQWRNNGYCGDLPVISSIGGKLRPIHLHTSGIENDMLEYLMNHKLEIRSGTKAGLKKILFA